MSYRKRRLRKKLHVGEFQQFYFIVNISVIPILEEAEHNVFIDSFIDYVDVRKLILNVFPHDDSYNIYIDGFKTRAAALTQRAEFLELLKMNPRISINKVSEQKDSWYDDGGDFNENDKPTFNPIAKKT